MGANYREANDALGKKDFLNRMKIARKETKETIHWLELVATANPDFESDALNLIAEATEYRNIFSTIINKSQQPLVIGC